MRSVSGRTVSERPISLSKASKVLAKFVTVDNGASAAIGVYLRKASNAFDELVQFHKGLKSSKADRTSKKASTLTDIQELADEDGESARIKHKSKERKAEDRVGIASDENVLIRDRKIDEAEVEHKKKKKEEEEVKADSKLAVGSGNAEEDQGRGHKRKKIEGAGADREGDGSVEQRHKKKKRK